MGNPRDPELSAVRQPGDGCSILAWRCKQERDEARLELCVTHDPNGEGDGALAYANERGWGYLFDAAPCTACLETCASQLEFVGSNEYRPWSMCSGCDPDLARKFSEGGGP